MPKLSSYPVKATPTTADEVVINNKADSDATGAATMGSMPISTAAQTALDLKAPLASPTFTGSATIPAVAGDVAFDTNVLAVDSTNDRVGMGTTAPDGTAHVFSGSAGVVTANGDADDLIVENSASGGISILTPSSGVGNIYFGDEASNIVGAVLYNHPTNYLQLNTAGVEALRIDSSQHVWPGTTESQDLGSVSKEWDNLYVQNSPTVSDERRKNSIVDIEYAAELLKALEPVQFKYNDTVIPATEDQPEKTITHSRPHTGFIAQQVKESMTAAGLEDWAGYAYDEEEDLHSLRLNEFIGVLVAGYKSLDARVSALEAK